MKKILKLFKPFDYLLIFLAILLSFTPMIVSTYIYQRPANTTEGTSSLVAVVKIHGEIVDELPLDENAGSKLKTYHPSKSQYNIVETKAGSVRVKEDNSPDQVAVNTGWISKEGQILVCLPHELIIEIQRRGDADDDTKDDDELILPI